jgi:DNA-binding protein
MKRMSKENIVYIGRKPVMNYVLAVLSGFNQNDQGKVMLQARGRAISTAVDTSEVVRRLYMKDLNVAVSIGTEELSQEGYGKRNVSTMKIVLASKNHVETPKSAVEITEEAEVQKKETAKVESEAPDEEVDEG